MVGSAGSPAETRSVVATTNDNWTKKRKQLQEELPEMPFPKHPCWDQTPVGCSSPSEFSSDPNRVECGYTNSSACSRDSIMSTDEETKPNPGRQDTNTSDDPSNSSFSWGTTSSSDIDLYSSESQSTTKSKSTETETETTETTSFGEQPPDCPYHQCAALHLSEGYGLGLEGLTDCICSEYESNATVNEELEDLLCSTGVAPKNYVLSSGRWSVNQDARAQQGGEKLTIDKEFEQYFSMLML